MNSALTSPVLSRLELSVLARSNKGRKLRISVYRNHSFEMVASVLNAFLLESGLCAEFQFSAYDDSLTFAGDVADVSIIWVDASRYRSIDLSAFICERVAELRKISRNPVLVGCLGMPQLTSLPAGAYVFPVDSLIDSLGNAAYDLPKEAYSGTRLSSKAALELARHLGLRYLPAVTCSPLKAIIVDLDNTLYEGVLGEDGRDKLVPNIALQQALVGFLRSGGMLAIASKNDERDVRDLFERRTDFLLHWSDFAAYSIGWNDKAEGVRNIAKTLNIAPDAMLFVDDNLAEIQNVTGTGVRCLVADKNIVYNLILTPGFLRLRNSEEDALRTRDIQANAERMTLAENVPIDEYFAKLKICLSFAIDQEDQVSRISELLGKTNQFVLGYSRMTESDVLDRMRSAESCVVTVRMSDVLSDSGIIAIVVADRDAVGSLAVVDLAVSCRALGRKLENIMLPYMLQLASDSLGCRGMAHITYRRGPRNTPAMNWLGEISKSTLGESGIAVIDVSLPIDFHGISTEVVNGAL